MLFTIGTQCPQSEKGILVQAQMGKDSGIQLGIGILYSQEAEPASSTPKRPSFFMLSFFQGTMQGVEFYLDHGVPNVFHMVLTMFPISSTSKIPTGSLRCSHYDHTSSHILCPKLYSYTCAQNFLFVFVFVSHFGKILHRIFFCCFTHVLSCNCLSFMHMEPFQS